MVRLARSRIRCRRRVRPVRGWKCARSGQGRGAGPQRAPSSAPARSPRSWRTWTVRWPSITTSSAWRCRRCRRPASGRTTVPIRSCSRCSTSRARRNVTSRRECRARGTASRSWKSRTSRTRRIPLRIQDPGTATLVLVVRDIDAALARAMKANAPIVTPGGKPVTLSRRRRARS